MTRALIVGAGRTGARVARLLAAGGHEVTVLRRRADPVAGLPTICVDITDPHARTSVALPATDVVVVCVTAPDRTEDASRAVYVDGTAGVLAALGEQHGAPPRRVVLVSSTAVYGGGDGVLVDETTPTAPARWNGRVMVDAELAARACGAPEVAVARLGGIYGGGSNRLVARVRAGEEPVGPGIPDPFTNRIHVDDAVAALAALALHPRPPEVVNVVDDEPARRSDVVRYLAARLGVAVPTTGVAPAAGVPRDDKRVSNARLRALGVALRYPTYREGYDAVLAEEPAG